MPTLEQITSQHVFVDATNKIAFRQTPADAQDLDNVREFHVTLTISNWSGSGTVAHKLAHAPRNREADYVSDLWSVGGITGNTTTSTYITGFSRFTRGKIDATSGSAEFDVEELIVPKKG